MYHYFIARLKDRPGVFTIRVVRIGQSESEAKEQAEKLAKEIDSEIEIESIMSNNNLVLRANFVEDIVCHHP